MTPERRIAPRYRQALPLLMARPDGVEETVITRDVSCGGASFETEQPLEVGSLLKFVIQIDTTATGDSQVRIYFVGRVVRVGRGAAGRTAVGVEVSDYRFDRSAHSSEESGVGFRLKEDNALVFANPKSFPFTSPFVELNAPHESGVYGLHKAHGWVYIGESEDVQKTLTDHLTRRILWTDPDAPLWFTYDLVPVARRMARLYELLLQCRLLVGAHGPN